VAASADRQIENAVRYRAMFGDVAVYAVITVRSNRIVGNAAEAGVTSVQSSGFLIQVGIRKAEQKTVRVLML